MGAVSMFVTVKGLKIEYKDVGDGIPVLLLHGWASSFDVYNGVIAALGDRCRLVALNFPGCGQSETMRSPWNIDDYCDLVLEFIKAIGLEAPILIGHSHGGRVALRLTSTGRLSPPKMVLIDSAGIIPKKSVKQKLRAKNFKAIKRLLTLPGLKNHTAGLLERARAHYGSADYNAAPPVLRNTMVSLVNTDLRDDLHNISCPTLLIWGENDTATPLSSAEIIKERIPDAGLCVIKGTGHFSFCEKPYEAIAILRSFIK